MKFIQIRLNKDVPGFKSGQSIKVKADFMGIPLDKFWRDRLKDSELDGCIEIVKQKKIIKQKGTEE